MKSSIGVGSGGHPTGLLRSAFAWAILAGALGLIVSMAREQATTRTRVSVLEATLQAERASSVVLRAERDGLFDRLATRDLARPVLIGEQVLDGVPRHIQTIDADGVYYILSTECLACEQNLPMLEGLHATERLQVTAVSTRDSVSALHAYQRAHAIRFPMILADGGSLLATMPLHGTPLTMVVRNRRIRWLKSGKLTARDSSAIHQQLTSLVHGGVLGE